jgi:hypothetical protein
MSFASKHAKYDMIGLETQAALTHLYPYDIKKECSPKADKSR